LGPRTGKTDKTRKRKAPGGERREPPVTSEILRTRGHVVVEKTSDLVCITTFSLAPTYIFINPSHKDTLGYEPRDLIGKCALDFIHPADKKELVPLLEGYVRAKSANLLTGTGESVTEKVVYRFKDRWGNWRYLETTGDLLDDEHLLFISRDITEKKKLEEWLRRSEERYRLIVEDMPALTRRVLPDGTLTFVNSKYCSYFNRKKDALIGQNFFNLIPHEQRDKIRGHFSSLSPEKPMITYEHQVISPDGNLCWQRWTDRALFCENGAIREYQSLGIDITDQKLAEEALRESEEKYRLLVENADEAIFIVQDGRVKFPNRKAREIASRLGVGLEKEHFTDHIHPQDVGMVIDKHTRRLSGENVNDPYVFRLIGKDGKELWVELGAVLINWETKPATLNFLRDITRQREIEARLQHGRRMEGLGTLAGGVAHDFNNLLMSIQGRVSLMLMGMNSSHPHYDELRSIEEIVRSGADLTKQLLGFARGGKYEVKPTNLNGLILKASSMFGRTRKEIEIFRKFQEGLWTVEVDRGQMEQAMLNFFMNAWQAMPEGGALYLETENVILKPSDVELYQLPPGKYVKISVTDTGVGMDEATQQRVFEPFFSTKGMGRGAGLGLASTYGIVKNHNGIIEVHSKKGEGTTFNVFLPASTKQAVEERKPIEEILRGTETILLVDDEKTVLDVGEKILKAMGYEVLVAKNGREALDIYKDRKAEIDLVVLDMVMPVMSGGITFARLKAMDPNVKVLLSTGYSMEGEASEILDRGCDGFIQKPFRAALLGKMIRDILERD